MRFFTSLLLFLALGATTLAQSVQWLSADSGDPTDLQLVFDNCTPEDNPVLPTLADASLSFAGRSEQTSIINFKVTRSVVLNYRLRSRAGGSVQIPAFTVKTDQGDLRVPPFTTGAVRQAPEVNIQARLLPGSPTVWAGEVFTMNYTLDVGRRTFSQFGGSVEWDPAPFVVEDWSKAEAVEFTSGGEARLNITFKTRAYAPKAEPVSVKPVQQLINLSVGTVGFGLFQQQRIEQVAVTTNQPKLTVRPLPPAPVGFSGAVGQFKLDSKVVPTAATVGEPVTWTLELSGTGNWPEISGLPAREVSKDFQVIQPQAKRTPVEGKLFEVTLAEDVVLVPTRPGTYVLAPVDFIYFDPTAGEYKTLTTPRTTINVSAPAASRFNVIPPSDSDRVPVATARPAEAPAPPALPAAIPRDPLAGQPVAAKPFASKLALIGFVAAPFGGLLLFWLALAIRRAHRTDPVGAQRAARTRLGVLLRQFRAPGHDDMSLRKNLLQWQHDTARLWQIPHAAPPAITLPDAKWQTLWQEADRALYGTDRTLPADWVSRAEAALAAKKVPGFAPWRALLLRNLLPFFFTLCVLFHAPSLWADPETDYRAGNFAAAEKAWREALATAPTDWVARHNLALSLAQQSKWPEAAAHATAAFVQNPGSEANRWNLALAYEKAGYTPVSLAPFLHPGPQEMVAQSASPARWERVLVVAAGLVAVALGWLLFTAYQPQARWTKFVACTALSLGVVLAAAALSSCNAYGAAAHPEAAVVWRGTTLRSIPTEADTAQQTTTLAAGSVGIVDQTFLGWVRLNFSKGQTGWVRKTEIVRLWQ
jgi:hypothetical protein